MARATLKSTTLSGPPLACRKIGKISRISKLVFAKADRATADTKIQLCPGQVKDS